MNGDNMNEFEHAFIFVKEELSKANHFNTNLNKKKIIYSRFDHTQRVYKWVCRLIDLENVSNERAKKNGGNTT